MLLVIPLSTAVTLIVTVVLSICGGIAILIQTFLKDLYSRIEKMNQKFLSIDQRVDNIVSQINRDLSEINQKLSIFPAREELLVEKLNDLKNSQENVIDILKDLMLKDSNT